MIVRMATTSRPRQRDDHRLRVGLIRPREHHRRVDAMSRMRAGQKPSIPPRSLSGLTGSNTDHSPALETRPASAAHTTLLCESP